MGSNDGKEESPDPQESLFERLTWARDILGLAETATREVIDQKIKRLLKQWHPDCCQEDPVLCTRKTRQILEAAEIINGYCENYRYSFRQEEVEKHLTDAEWWRKRFGTDPIWG